MRWRRRVVLAMHVMEHAHGGWGGEGSVIKLYAVKPYGFELLSY